MDWKKIIALIAGIYIWLSSTAVPGPAKAAGTTVSFSAVPVLSYHQIRDWGSADSKAARTYIMPAGNFRDQMKMLHDSGFHTILPDQLLAFMNHGTPLPERPVMLTFDDGTYGQYVTALPELERYGFKAVFFIMTVTRGKPGYMNDSQIRRLSRAGHIIGCHTWDHHDVRQYTAADWQKQLDNPTHILETITGARPRFFAYPYGAWNTNAITELKRKGYLAAFQLAGKTDITNPLFTIRRTIAEGKWNGRRLAAVLKMTH